MRDSAVNLKAVSSQDLLASVFSRLSCRLCTTMYIVPSLSQEDMCPFSVGLVNLYINHLSIPKNVVMASLVHFHRHTVSAFDALQTAPWETSCDIPDTH